MAATIDIVNRALGYLGEAFILNIGDASPNAEKMRRLWPDARDAVLRAHLWKCCRRRMRLPKLAERPAFGFAHAFQLPPDFLRLAETSPRRIPYQVEGNRILADTAELSIDYVAREENSEVFDSLLVEALALKLAADAAYGSTASGSLSESLEARYRRVLAEAAATDAREGNPHEPPPKGTWVSARRGRSCQ